MSKKRNQFLASLLAATSFLTLSGCDDDSYPIRDPEATAVTINSRKCF